MLQNLGIIAGGGDLPAEIAKIQTKSGGKCFIASLDVENDLGEFDCKHFSLGSVGKIIDYFKENFVENIVIIGNINRPDFKSLKVDFPGSILLAKLNEKCQESNKTRKFQRIQE
jgi:DUF1009 family protein